MSQTFTSLKSTMNTGKIKSNRVRNILIGLYILIVLGISASARASSLNLSFPAAAQVEFFTGQIALTLDGTSFLIISENEFYQLKGAEGVDDLAQFNGEVITVKGFKLIHNSGPVLTLHTIDPLGGNDVEKRAAPVLIVLGISDVAP